MFNFTTLTVYNNITVKTDEEVKAGAKANVITSTNSRIPAIRIGNTRFDADSIIDILVKNPTEENLAKVTFDLSKVIPSEGSTTGRIVLYIGLAMNCLDSLYSNNFVYKGKPLFIEFPVSSTDSADIVAKRVEKIAKKYLLFNFGTEKLLNVTKVANSAVEADALNNIEASDAVGTITFEGVNGYQIIKKAILQVWDPEAKKIDCCTKNGEYIDVVIGVPMIYTASNYGVITTTDYYVDEDGNKAAIVDPYVGIEPGLEAFGDYNWIINNLRLPTAANTNFWSPSKRMGEMPIPGQVYTLFIIRMQKERDGIMGEIVGARGVSVTTHVLYVAGKISDTTSAAYAIKNSLNSLASAKMKTTADTALQTPYAGIE